MKKIKNYLDLTNHGDCAARMKVLELMDGVLQEIDAARRILSIMRLDGDMLTVGTSRWNLNQKRNIYLLGAGKACNAMAMAVCEILGERITKGIISVKIAEESDRYVNTDVYIGGHPLPNEEGMQAALAMIELIRQAKPEDLFITVCSGGSSALLTCPVESISLEDEILTQDLLLKSGAKILEINAVRRHISRTNGGKLAEMICHEIGAELISFQVSDGVGRKVTEDWGIPTAFQGTPFNSDQTTVDDARRMIINYALRDKIPKSVISFLFDDARVKETASEINPEKITTFLLGTLPDSCRAAEKVAEKMGIPCTVLTTFLEGESADAGMFFSSLVREVRANQRPFKAPCFIVCAGETTAKIDGEPRGKGGPSQELVLGAALGIKGVKGVAVASIDTEGTDGPTVYAGGMVDGSSLERVEAVNGNIHDALRFHYSGNLLEKLGDAIFTGNTGTNLCDFDVIYVGRE